MTGDENDGHVDADEPRSDRDRDGSSDEDGGFVFGSESDTGDEPRREPTQEGDTERRIRVDLQSDDSEDPSRSEPPDRDPDRDPPESGPDPGANAVRNWTLLLLALSLASLATAAVTFTTQDALPPVVGATILGLGFAALASIAWNTDAPVLELLSRGWVEHRRYTWFATGLFAAGIAVGALFLLAGVNFLELIADVLGESPLPELEDEELTATFFIVNNTGPFLLSIVGALSLGLLTAFVMFFNGLIVGNLSADIAGTIGLDYIVTGLVPHGVFELSALFIAAGVGFRLIYRLAERILDERASFLTKAYVSRTLALVGFAWLLLALAAFVEAYVTPELLEMLFAERLEAIAASPDAP